MLAMLLNPGRKKRRRRVSRSVKSSVRKKILRRFVCHPRRVRSQRSTDVQRYCLPKRKRGRRKKASAAAAMPYGRGPVIFGFNRRRRRRNPGAAFNYRASRRNYSHWIPAYGSNPAAAGVLSGFNFKTIQATVPVLGGFIGNKILTATLSRYMPAMLAKGPGNYALGFLSSGLLAALVGMVNRGWAGSVLFGGVIQVVTNIAYENVLPMIGYKPMLTGFGDYLTMSDARNARPLYGMENLPMLGLGADDELDGFAQDDLEGLAVDEEELAA